MSGRGRDPNMRLIKIAIGLSSHIAEIEASTAVSKRPPNQALNERVIRILWREYLSCFLRPLSKFVAQRPSEVRLRLMTEEELGGGSRSDTIAPHLCPAFAPIALQGSRS